MTTSGAALVITTELHPLAHEVHSAIIAGRREFNERFVSRSMPEPFAVMVRDASGQAIGGLDGSVRWGWMFIDHFWLPEPIRGRGMGTAVLQAAETLARRRGCVGCYLDTFDFQARPFYERQGYRVFGTLDAYPEGSRRHYLVKRFDEPAIAPTPASAPASASASASASPDHDEASCVFCAIVRGEVACSRVTEDASTLAFVDLRQWHPGHVLIIPKRHVRDIRDADDDLAAAVMRTTARVARAVDAAFPSDGLSVWHSAGAGANQEVFHLHVHVHPRRFGDGVLDVYPGEPPTPPREVLHDHAQRLRELLRA